MACPYCLFPSIFKIFVEILFICLCPLISKSNIIFSFFLLDKRICESKGSFVFTQQNPTISVFFQKP